MAEEDQEFGVGTIVGSLVVGLAAFALLWFVGQPAFDAAVMSMVKV